MHNEYPRYWEVQVEIGENIQGWVFWTWKVVYPIAVASIFHLQIVYDT
jgi:hypothetical protein